MLLSFVFSFRNEEESIPELVRRVHDAVARIHDCDYEMVFVNDCSTDNSLNLLLELQDDYPITIVNTSRRFGVTPCVLAGMSQTKGDAVVYMDADLQDPPEIVPEMVSRFRAGAEVVHTTRTQRHGESRLKEFLTAQAYWLINLFSDISLPSNTGDFKLLSARVVQEILALGEYDPYMRGLSVWVGFKQDFVVYERDPRWGGDTKFPLWSKNPRREFVRGLTAFSATPLYFSFIIGFLVSLLAAGLVLYALITKFLGIAAPGTSGVLIAVAFFSGIVLMTNGIIGIYISQIYYEVKGRPRYIIDNVIEHRDRK